ncbi:sugar phosphate isomerase/epimerase [Streptomyces sp. XD-27]|uniref:sugar phosphate isomerase/epimerase family protein n=1 Tax=Streptomyces sp. XD-27 TaxID=3062779 RepID=UPI0026F478B6|nr:sugar phosphate isomerase/epimerase family protein [Streptomyces sp. XD-27]WKX70424.1 sugar phosphate isomerase/epimerase family protein [Streptomyces sp. XD-27]
MKLAFSTLGVSGLPVPQVAALAAEHGYHGVELRTHPEEPVHPGLDAAGRAAVVEAFRAVRVEIATVAGYVRVAEAGPDEPVVAGLRELSRLAADLGAPFVRVFPGGSGQAPAEADAAAARRLAAAAPYAAGLGVRLLLETHDSHPTGADTARVLADVQADGVGAIWDLMHPWLGGEEPADTFAALAPHLGCVQVKDIASAEDTTPLPLGDGVLPLGECVELLSRSGWEGWLCWEYERHWYPQVAPLPGLLGPARDHLMRLLADAA